MLLWPTEIIMWISSFILLIWCITLTDSQILTHPCILGINHSWSWCIMFFICFCIQFASIWLGISAYLFIQISVCSFLVMSLSGFTGSTGNTGLIE